MKFTVLLGIKLDSQILWAHAQLRKKRSYRKARDMVKSSEVSMCRKLPTNPASSSMEMETLMKRLDVDLKDMDKANVWKAKVIVSKLH